MTPIVDLDVYTAGMKKGIQDKLWFMDKLDGKIDSVYDYGCADGSLLNEIYKTHPELSLYGYDNNEEMLERAKKICPFAVFSNTPRLSSRGKSVLVASSVFHEIHSYSMYPQQDYLRIFDSGYKYIAIRDMFYTESSNHLTNVSQLVSVLNKEPEGKIKHFESFHGSLLNNKNFLHYLLKYRYQINWTREVAENYFPHSFEEFLNKIPNTYKVIFASTYTLPFLKDRVYEDFGFQLEDTTHGKILLELK